jgi:hypothetical protein
MQLKYTACLLAGLMCAMSLASIAARPNAKAAGQGARDRA